MAAENRDVVIVGGGPAGMMAGYLLARAGVAVTVLEKHADFFRDFRGDTVHPSTMQILDELGLLEQFLQRPHNRIDRAEVSWNGRILEIGDLSHLNMPAPFIAMMPQWEFLDFLRVEGAKLPGFSVRMSAPASGFVEEAGRIIGVKLGDGSILNAGLTIACDGRASLARGILPLESLGAPIDVFWFGVPKQSAGQALRAVVAGERLIVMIDRGDYWQCAFVIAKGGAEAIKARGIAAFRADVLAAAPELIGLEIALPDWDRVNLLAVSLDRLSQWSRPGMLAIGDAAHAMSPVGGIGINLAIQDAVAAANLLALPLSRGESVDRLLGQVQARRWLPTRLVQGMQRTAHERILRPLIEGRAAVPVEPPLPLRLLNRFPLLRRIPGYMIGHGFRQEHVRSPIAVSAVTVIPGKAGTQS